MSQTTIVCPFCPLHCADLNVHVGEDQNLRVVVDCHLAKARFDQALRSNPLPRPRIENQEVDFIDVEQAFRDLIERNAEVQFLVRESTLSLSRWLSQCSDQIQVFTESTETEVAIRSAVNRCGVITATLGDVQQHADTILWLGDLETHYPRLRERLVSEKADKPSFVHLPSVDADLIAELCLGLKGIGSAQDQAVQDVVEVCRESRYLAIFVSPTAVDGLEAESTIELLVDTVLNLNQPRRESSENQRVVTVFLDPAATLRSVTAWTRNQRLSAHVISSDDNDSGLPGKTSVRIGDGVSGMSAFVEVQIGGTDPGPAMARIYMPTAIAGVHHDDAVIRGDGTVTLPLKKIGERSMRTIADWLMLLIPSD